MMTIQKAFSIILLAISFLGIVGSLSLDLLGENNVGPGFMPLIYSLILACCAVVLYFEDKSKSKISLKRLVKRPLADSLFFYMMMVGLYFCAVLFGMLPAIGIFSIIVLIQQRRMKKIDIAVFEVCFVLALYFLFDVLLGIPFEGGVLFR